MQPATLAVAPGEGECVSERRTCKRYASPPVLCEVEGEAGRCTAFVVDLSAHGAGLLVAGAVEPGEVLRLRLWNGRHLFCLLVSIRVSHRHGEKNGPHLVGGPFLSELPHTALCALLS